MENLGLIEKTKIYCKEMMEASRCQYLPFHNWKHTKEVVENSKTIAKGEHLPNETIEELIIASYFHDLGNSREFSNHERVSCKFAQNFLSKQGFSIHRTIHITQIIEATQMPQNPKTITQKVICDADLTHLGKKNFLIKNLKLRKEWAAFNNQKFSDREWIFLNIDFLERHNFYTAFARKHFTTQKNENIKLLKSLI